MANFFTRTKGDMQYLFQDSNHLNDKNKRRKRRAIIALIGFILTAIQFVLMIVFSVKLMLLNVLPTKYFAMIIIVLLLLLAYCVLAQFSKMHGLGKALSVFISAILVFGVVLTSQINSAFENMTDTRIQTDVINIVVPADSSYSSIKDVLGETFGINSTVDTTLINKAIDRIDQENNASIRTNAYGDWDSLLNALYAGSDIKAMIISDATFQTLVEHYPDITTKTKTIHTINIDTEIKIEVSDKDVSNSSFIVYLSGNDGRGKVTSTGRSDVNIIAVINPNTRQILLVSTPRDYYVNITNADGKKGLDKLTHAGVSGIEYSIKALEELYKIDIDYYGKINFSGCVDIVDALGGITINSDVAFTNGTDAAPIRYNFVKGPNQCDGEKTLAFVRERHVFAAGDIQRGRNQQAAISAIIDKVTSPAILANYSKVLEVGSKMVVTNMPTSKITDLIKAQIANPTAWNVQSYSAAALTHAYRDLYVTNYTQKSVIIPDYNSINDAIELMNKTYNGEHYDISQYTTAAPNYETLPPKPSTESEEASKETATKVKESETATQKESQTSNKKPTTSATKPTTSTKPTSSTKPTTTKPSSSSSTEKTSAATSATKPISSSSASTSGSNSGSGTNGSSVSNSGNNSNLNRRAANNSYYNVEPETLPAN